MKLEQTYKVYNNSCYNICFIDTLSEIHSAPICLASPSAQCTHRNCADNNSMHIIYPCQHWHLGSGLSGFGTCYTTVNTWYICIHAESKITLPHNHHCAHSPLTVDGGKVEDPPSPPRTPSSSPPKHLVPLLSQGHASWPSCCSQGCSGVFKIEINVCIHE